MALTALLAAVLTLAPFKDGTPRSAKTASPRHVVTPDLARGDYKAAQNKSRVHLPNWSKTELYSGFFEIDAATGSNTYFMFSTPMSGRKDAPVLLWLNGGPGASSLLGFYDELGPFEITPNLTLAPRAVSWTLDAYLIALDNPLGVGFSHTNSKARMATNQSTVGADLYTALSQFYDMFPDLRANAFYATGESYAGKYVPAVAYTIHERNKMAPPSQQINLKGLAIGDGAFDPATQFTGFGPLLFNIGLADTRAKKVFDQFDVTFKARLAAGDHVGAFHSFDAMINGDYYGTSKTFYNNVSGMGSNYFNFAEEPGAASLTKRTFPSWLALPSIAEALHVGNVPYALFNQTVEDQLVGDWTVGVVPWLEELLDHYDVLIYSGQYDVILGPPGTERALDLLNWTGANGFASAPTQLFKLNSSDPTSDLAGYSRTAKSASSTNLTYVMLRGCGHMVPTDQPVRAYSMMQRFLVPMAPLPKDLLAAEQ